MPARWSRAPQARRTTLPVPAREAGRGSTRGSEHAEDRNDRPQGGNLPLAAAGRWLSPRASVLAHGRGVEAGRQSRRSNGIKPPAACRLGTVRWHSHPPVYAGWIPGCGGRGCGVRGAEPDSGKGAWCDREGAAGVRHERGCTGAGRHDAAVRSIRMVPPSSVVRTGGNHESGPETADSNGALRGAPAERGAPHTVGAGGETSLPVNSS